jgi:hypothetical protein
MVGGQVGVDGTRTPGWRSGSREEGHAATGLELLVGAATGGVQASG